MVAVVHSSSPSFRNNCIDPLAHPESSKIVFKCSCNWASEPPAVFTAWNKNVYGFPESFHDSEFLNTCWRKCVAKWIRLVNENECSLRFESIDSFIHVRSAVSAVFVQELVWNWNWMVPNGTKWSWTGPSGPERDQMVLNGTKWSGPGPNGLDLDQMVHYAPKWS